MSFEFITHYSADELTDMQLTQIENNVPAAHVAYLPARTGVRLFTVTYHSVIPELNNKPTLATGLLVIPDTPLAGMPIVSYQHGTVFGKMDVPSQHQNSFETMIMIAQFAGFGYILMSADYFGLGAVSTEQDSYFVVNSQTQACADLLQTVRAYMDTQHHRHPDHPDHPLLLTGWSQGGIITMALLQRYEMAGIPVAAAATAAAQCDGFALISQYLTHPRVGLDAWWLGMCIILTAFAFETYYNEPGLTDGIFIQDQHAVARRIYEHDPTLPITSFPTSLESIIKPQFFDPVFFRKSRYGRLIHDKLSPYRFVIQTPMHMHYGERDECLTPGIARMPATFQDAMNNTGKIVAISEGPDADHRITFARAVPKWRAWFLTIITT